MNSLAASGSTLTGKKGKHSENNSFEINNVRKITTDSSEYPPTSQGSNTSGSGGLGGVTKSTLSSTKLNPESAKSTTKKKPILQPEEEPSSFDESFAGKNP
jgi:hypothetical protein